METKEKETNRQRNTETQRQETKKERGYDRKIRSIIHI
jgi:hypothetical protein